MSFPEGNAPGGSRLAAAILAMSTTAGLVVGRLRHNEHA